MTVRITELFKTIISGFASWVLNSIIGHIPCWPLRKLVLKLYGMSIGDGSRILLGCRFQHPRGIVIGSHSYINYGCHLDGRGGLLIGDNVNISNYCRIITASHDMHSETFEYRTGQVVIEDYCWLGTGAIVLDRSSLRRSMVLGAGSVFKGEGKPDSVYAGNPAIYVKERGLDKGYDVVWRPWFV